MILVILYTLILLFTDKDSVSTMCLQALKQWYETMIPALFPMMLLSSILVDCGFAGKIGRIVNCTLLRFLHISDNGCYCLMAGFFFGFPMGAKTTADIYLKKQLSKKEAEFLLSFINCLGPMYTINLTYMLFSGFPLWKLLTGLYATALSYGTFLRYTVYRKNSFDSNAVYKATASPGSKEIISHDTFCDALYNCVPKCGKSILLLGGYMILFQISFVTLNHLLRSINLITYKLHPMLEITGGFFFISPDTTLQEVLFYSAFTGACCHLQTYSFLKPAGLSVSKYLLHKIILSVICFGTGVLLSYM